MMVPGFNDGDSERDGGVMEVIRGTEAAVQPQTVCVKTELN